MVEPKKLYFNVDQKKVFGLGDPEAQGQDEDHLTPVDQYCSARLKEWEGTVEDLNKVLTEAQKRILDMGSLWGKLLNKHIKEALKNTEKGKEILEEIKGDNEDDGLLAKFHSYVSSKKEEASALNEK